MKFLLLPFVVALAYGALRDEVKEFEPKRVYSYQYNVQLSTGSPKSTNLYSGLKLESTLNLYFQSDRRTVTAKLSDVRLLEMKQWAEEKSPQWYMQPSENLQEVNQADLVSEMIPQFEKPFQFNWNKGNVSKLRLNKKEPWWSTNIKRGVASLFQVQLNEDTRESSWRQSTSTDHPLRSSFSVWENTPVGLCQTRYTPQPQFFDPSGKTEAFYVVKVRDYTTCPYHPYGGQTQSEEESKHLNVGARVTYSIRGNKDRFVILSAMGEGKIAFQPYGVQGGNVQTSINQTLVLTQTKSLREVGKWIRPLDQDKLYQPSRMLMHVPVRSAQDFFPYQLMPRQNDSSYTPRYTQAKMGDVLEWLHKASQDGATEESLTTSQALLEMIRESRQPELQKLLRSILRKSLQLQQDFRQMPKKLELFWYLLHKAGTTESTKVVLDCCSVKKQICQDLKSTQWLNSRMCRPAFTSIALWSPPSQDILEKMMTMIENSTMYSPPSQLQDQQSADSNEDDESRNEDSDSKSGDRKAEIEQYKDLTLALGSVFGRAGDQYKIVERRADQLCNELKDVKMIEDKCEGGIRDQWDVMKRIHKQLVDRFEDLIESRYLKRSAKSQEIGLKSLRNAHISGPDTKSFDMIRKRLDNSKSVQVKTAAAQAFEKFSQRKPQVYDALEEIVKNPGEKVSVRIQAFRSLINLRVPRQVLERVASSIRYEQQKQLSTYVWSVIDKMSNCSYAPHRSMSKLAQQVRPFMQPVEYGIQDSHHNHVHVALTDKIAALVESNYVSTPNMTTSADSSLLLNMFGSSHELYKISVRTEGIERVIKKLFGADGILTKKSSLFDLLKRTKRAIGVDYTLKQIFHKLQIATREIPLPKGQIEIQVLNKVVRQWDLDEMLQKFLKTGKFSTSFDEDQWRAGVDLESNSTGVAAQYFRELPTESGFPVTLSMGLDYAWRTSGQAQASAHPSIFRNKRKGDREPPKQLKATFKMDTDVSARLSGKMAIDAYLLQCGSQFNALAQARLPVSIESSIDLAKARVTTHIEPPTKSDSPVLKFDVKPFVYTRITSKGRKEGEKQQKEDKAPMSFSTQYMDVSRGSEIKQSYWQYGKKIMGFKTIVQGRYPWSYARSAVMSPLNGRSHWSVYMEPSSQTPPRVTVDFRYFSPARVFAKDSVKSEEEQQKEKEESKPVCDSSSILGFFTCRGTNEDAPVHSDLEQPSGSQVPSLSEYPDLGSDISFASLKKKIEERVGHPVPESPSNSQYGFILLINTSRGSDERQGPNPQRLLVLKSLLQAWRDGKYHQSYFHLHRSPILDYDSQPWQILVKSSTVFPTRKFNVRDLMETKYQEKLHKDLYSMLQLKEHVGINQNIRQILQTSVAKQSMKKLPSKQPDLLIQRIIAERLVQNEYGDDILSRILRSVLPISEEVERLGDEMKDSFKISDQKDKLYHLGQTIARIQEHVKQKMMSIVRNNRYKNISGVNLRFLIYTLAKTCNTYQDIVSRGLHLQLFQTASRFLTLENSNKTFQESMESVQEEVRLKMLHLFVYITKQSQDYLKSSSPMERNPEGESEQSTEERLPKPTNVSAMQAMKELIEFQVDAAIKLWSQRQVFVSRAEEKARSVDEKLQVLDDWIRTNNGEESEDVKERVLQAAIQQLVLVEAAKRKIEGKEQVNLQARHIMKQHAMMLTERFALLHTQSQLRSTCLPSIKEQEKTVLNRILNVDSYLATLEKHHDTQPSQWQQFENASRLQETKSQLFGLKESLESSVEQLSSGIAQSVMTHACVLGKLMDTITTFRQGVQRINRQLISYPSYPAELFKDFKKLEDASYRLQAKLSKVFDKYSKPELGSHMDMFPPGNLFVSSGLIDITRLFNDQELLYNKMFRQVFRYTNMPNDYIKDRLEFYTNRSKDLLQSLEEKAESVQSAMRSESFLSALSIWEQYRLCLQKQEDIYSKLPQLVELAERSGYSKIKGKLEQIREKDVEHLNELIAQANSWSLPDSQEYGQYLPEEDKDETNQGPSDEPQDSDDDPRSGYQYDDIEQAQQESQEREDWKRTSSSERAERESERLEPRIEYKTDRPSQFDINSIFFNANISYTGHQPIIVNVRAMKSAKQMLWELSQYYASARDSWVACAMQARAVGRDQLETCAYQVYSRLNSYDHVHAQIKAEQPEMPPEARQWLNWFTSKLQYRYQSSVPQYPRIPIDRNSVQAIWEFTPCKTAASMNVMTPEKSVQVDKMLMPYPAQLGPWYPFQNVDQLSTVALMKYSARQIPSTCRLNGNRIKTNDGLVWSVPSSDSPMDKEYLWAADCSQDKTFAVTIVRKKNFWELRVKSAKSEVSVTPGLKDIVRVKGAGKEIDEELTYGSPIERATDIAYNQKALWLQISRTKEGSIRINLPLVGLDITYGFNTIDAKISSVYKNQLCGLCGNFDGQQTLEFEGPKKEIYSSSVDFFKSYLVERQTKA